MTEAMDCSALRERLNQDPARPEPAFLRHAESCQGCRAYLHRLVRAEALVARALRFDVAAFAARTGTAARSRMRGRRWITLTAGLAASVVAGLTLFGLHLSRSDPDPADLALAVSSHWDHEPESWVRTDLPVSTIRLAEVLDGRARLDLGRLQTVSFAKSCLIGGRLVPHLVIQGDGDPYMVVLFPDRRLESAVPLEVTPAGLAGHLLPAGAGSIAVLGAPTAELERMERAVRAALEWTI